MYIGCVIVVWVWALLFAVVLVLAFRFCCFIVGLVGILFLLFSACGSFCGCFIGLLVCLLVLGLLILTFACELCCDWLVVLLLIG